MSPISRRLSRSAMGAGILFAVLFSAPLHSTAQEPSAPEATEVTVDTAAEAESRAIAVRETLVEVTQMLIDQMGLLAFSVTLLIGLLIVGSFLYLQNKYLGALRRARNALSGAAVRVTGSEDAASQVFPDGPERLRDLWTEFLDEREATTLVHKGNPLSTVDPADIFHDDAIFDAYNRNFAGTVAGFFTGLGILGTFAGLVIGLHRIDTSPEGMLNSVGNLLGGMSAAFYTSLIGILFSLIWLVWDRVLLHDVHRAASRFFLKVRQKYPVESADRLLHHLLTVEQEENQAIQDSKGLLAEQKGILQSMSVDLAVAFEEAVTQSLEATLAPQLQKMAEAVDSLSVQMGDRQVDALNEMVGTFQEKLSAELHGHLDGLADGLARASEWQERVHSRIGEVTEQLALAANRQAELLEATNSASAAFSGSLQSLSNANRELEESLNHLRASAGEMQSLAESIGGQATRLEERIDELGREHEVYRDANEEIREQLARHSDSLDRRLEDLDQLWSSLGEDLNAASDKLMAGASEFSNLTTQKLGEIFARFDSEMASVVEHLAGTLSEIREVTDRLPGVLEEMRSTLGAHSSGMTSATAQLDKTVERLDALEELADTMSRLDTLGKSIHDAAGRMQDASGAFSRLVELIEQTNVAGSLPSPGGAETDREVEVRPQEGAD